MVLFRQYFGGGHNGSLKVAFGFQCGQHGKCGDDGFAAAYVALQQAVHGVRLSHVGADFVQHAGLGIGEGKR